MARHRIVSVPLLFCVFLSCGNTPSSWSLPTERISFLSSHVRDSFDIYITLPSNYSDSEKKFPVIFYTDATLKSGNELRAIIDEFSKEQRPIGAVFVGIGHFGNFHTLRRRDFVTPDKKDKKDSLISDDPNNGQAQNFYFFLQNELIPYIEQSYRVTHNRTLIGHSLGGLFTFYCLFKKTRLFTNFVALSPSLWINSQNIYDFEKAYRADSTSLHANIFLCVGGAERLNFILYGAHKMKAHLEKNPLGGLNFEYHEFPGETHNSEVPLALRQLLPTLKLQ